MYTCRFLSHRTVTGCNCRTWEQVWLFSFKEIGQEHRPIYTSRYHHLFKLIKAYGLMIWIVSSWFRNGSTLTLPTTRWHSSIPSTVMSSVCVSEIQIPLLLFLHLVTLARTTCVSSAAVRRWQTWHTSEQWSQRLVGWPTPSGWHSVDRTQVLLLLGSGWSILTWCTPL